MPSALFMVHTRSAVRTAVAHTRTPAAAIYQANQLVVQESTNGLFVTLMYGRLDTRTGQLIYVNAGHNPALHYQAASGQLIELTRTGLPLGILEETPYEQQTSQIQPGDFVVFYTDGVTEAMNETQEEFGLAQLMAVLTAQPTATAEAVALAVDTAVNQFVGATSPHDDFTLLIVKRPAVST
jgi:sigma-B regulation protein RsbU (phosphoserine phosphatase)